MVRNQRRPSRSSKFANLTDEVIQQRWQSLKPKALKGTGMFLAIMAVSFLLLHFAYPVTGQPHQPAFLSMEYILSLVFQISCVFSGCGAFLSLMCLLYGRGAPKSSAAN